MLRQIRLANFKGIEKAEINTGVATILIGPNGVGKSSVAQALILMRQSNGRDELVVNGPLIQLGKFQDIVRKGKKGNILGIGLSVDMKEEALLGISEDTIYSYDATFVPRLNSYEARIGENEVPYWAVKGVGNKTASISPNSIEWPFPNGKVILEFVANRVLGQPIGINVSHTAGLAIEADNLKVDIQKKFAAISEQLNHTVFVPAIRGFDVPSYNLLDKPSSDFVPGQNAEVSSTFVYADTEIRNKVSEWSEYITGSRISPRVIPGKKVVVESYGTPEGIPVCVDGFGTNQLVQLLMSFAMADEKSIIAIEEPEIHLHPKGQDKLSKVLIDEVIKERKQVILTTHSEHILYAFVSAVKSRKLSKEDLKIYYLEDKGIEPREVEMDEYGDIYDWGKNFFVY